MLTSNQNPIPQIPSRSQVSIALPSPWYSCSVPLSEDLVREILSWLPVASLVRFKSVCKSWYSLIESSCFINHHLSRHRHQSLFIMDNTHRYDEPRFHLHTSLPSCHSCVFSRDIDLPNLSNTVYHMSMLTCNGLVCFCYLWDKNVLTTYSSPFRHPDDEYFIDATLYNPSTRQVRRLPRPVVPCQQRFMSFWQLSNGFGFDILTNDYKLVLIFIYDDAQRTQIQVYNLSTNSWRIIDAIIFPIDCVRSIFSDIKAPYKNGSYCWMGTKNFKERNDNDLLYDRIILSFDFSTEKFDTIQLPDDFDVKRDPYPMCAVLNGDIACINRAARLPEDSSLLKRLEIWVLKEYGIRESWTKLYTVGPFLNSIPRGILKNRFLLLAKSNQFCIYDIITGESKKIAAREEKYRDHDHQGMEIVIYEESLVSIKAQDAAWDEASPEDNSDSYSWLPQWNMLRLVILLVGILLSDIHSSPNSCCIMFECKIVVSAVLLYLYHCVVCLNVAAMNYNRAAHGSSGGDL